MENPKTPSIFILPLEIRQIIYENLFHEDSKIELSLGPWSYTRHEAAKARAPLLLTHRQIGSELREWTVVRLKPLKKVSFVLHTHFRYLRVTKLELKDFRRNFTCQRLERVEIYIPYYDTEQTLKEQYVNPYAYWSSRWDLSSPRVQKRQLRSLHQHMKAVVKTLNKVCQSIGVLTIEYDPAWYEGPCYRYHHWWRSELLAARDPSWLGFRDTGDPAGTVGEYVLQPLRKLNVRCERVVVEDTERAMDLDLRLGSEERVEELRTYFVRLNRRYIDLLSDRKKKGS